MPDHPRTPTPKPEGGVNAFGSTVAATTGTGQAPPPELRELKAADNHILAGEHQAVLAHNLRDRMEGREAALGDLSGPMIRENRHHVPRPEDLAHLVEAVLGEQRVVNLNGGPRQPCVTVKTYGGGGLALALGGPDIRMAVAERIVACWNACAGVPTAELYARKLKEMAKTIKFLSSMHDEPPKAKVELPPEAKKAPEVPPERPETPEDWRNWALGVNTELDVMRDDDRATRKAVQDVENRQKEAETFTRLLIEEVKDAARKENDGHRAWLNRLQTNCETLACNIGNLAKQTPSATWANSIQDQVCELLAAKETAGPAALTEEDKKSLLSAVVKLIEDELSWVQDFKESVAKDITKLEDVVYRRKPNTQEDRPTARLDRLVARVQVLEREVAEAGSALADLNVSTERHENLVRVVDRLRENLEGVQKTMSAFATSPAGQPDPSTAAQVAALTRVEELSKRIDKLAGVYASKVSLDSTLAQLEEAFRLIRQLGDGQDLIHSQALTFDGQMAAVVENLRRSHAATRAECKELKDYFGDEKAIHRMTLERLIRQEESHRRYVDSNQEIMRVMIDRIARLESLRT